MAKEISTDITLSKQYCLEPLLFHDMPIDELGFSVRAFNCLKRHNPPIDTVEDLLKYSFDDLKEIRNFGAKCVREVDSIIQDLQAQNITLSIPAEDTTKTQDNRWRVKREYRDCILKGDFGFLNQLEGDECLEGEIIRDAYNDLGSEFIQAIVEHRSSMKLTLGFIEQEAKKYDFDQFVSNQIKKAKEQFPSERLSNRIEGFIYAYTRDDNKKEQLLNWVKDNDYVEFKDIRSSKGIDANTYSLIIAFIRWCAFDLEQEIRTFLETVYKDEREAKVIRFRANGSTLQETGDELGVTRERVRQIEHRVRRDFNASIARSKIILKIYATRNQDDVLTPVELQDYFGEETKSILYLLRISSNASYVYDHNLDVLIVANDGLSARTTSFIEELPDTFNSDKLKDYIQLGIDEYDLGEEIIETALHKEYKKTGNVYHRSALKLSGMYDVILRKYYPKGLYVYGDEELQQFRERIKETFGEVPLPANNRALTARICDVGILCRRGTYKAKTERYLSNDLKESIFDYIDQNEQGVVLINTLFSAFEEQLKQEGVDNRYYLQGILREYFGDHFFFRKDYIAKDKETTSIHERIVSFISTSEYPVTKGELQEMFPGVTDIILHMAMSDSDILNLFGRYIHASRLKITESEKRYLRACIDRCIAENNPTHCKTIYEYIANDNSALLINNYIDFAFSMYSLLEYYFRADYEFSRPFVATKGTVIDTVKNIMMETVASSDEISIDEIRSFAGEHHINIYSMLDFLNSCNETHLIADSNQVVCVEMTGLNKEISDSVEKLIYDSLDEQDTIPIAHLECVSLFPKIEVPWTAWLIYSTMKKWGTTVDVDVSSNYMRSAVPLISRHGEMNIEQYKKMNVDSVGDVFVPDNLENIDELTATFSDEDWEEFLI